MLCPLCGEETRDYFPPWNGEPPKLDPYEALAVHLDSFCIESHGIYRDEWTCICRARHHVWTNSDETRNGETVSFAVHLRQVGDQQAINNHFALGILQQL